MGRYAKPDLDRVRHSFEWTILPERNDAPPPPLPAPPVVKGRERPWSDVAVRGWERLWRSPQSTQWTGDFFSITATWLHLYEAMHYGVYSVLPGLSRIEDSLGLNPKAMLRLHWRHSAHVAEPRPVEVVPPARHLRLDPRSATG